MNTLIARSFISSLVLFSVFAQGRAEACMDGRIVKIDCSRENKVLTHYGCEEEYFVQCLALSEIPLIEGKTSGGFRRDPQIDLTTIGRDGKVVQTQKIMERGTQKWKIKTAETMVLGKPILKQIDQSFTVLKAAPYIRSTEPECMDAPTTEFTAYVARSQTSVEEIPFFKVQNCRELVTESAGAYELKSIAQAADALSSLAFQ